MSLKSSTNKVVLDNYEKNGLEHTLSLCNKILLNKSLYREGANYVVGELAESVLEVLVKDFIRRNNLKDWFYVKSMIIKDVETMSKKFSTEIDLVLFSPGKIYLFECKGYKGSKEIVGKGVLVRKGKNKLKFDVFEQHKNHANVFMKMFDPFILKGVDPRTAYQLGIFDYSLGELEDNREDTWKKVMPILKYSDIFPLLDRNKNSKRKWNMEYVRKAVNIIESKKDVSVTNHLKYVTSINRNNS